MGAAAAITGPAIEAMSAVGGSIAQSNAIKSQSRFQQQQLEFNAKLLDEQVKDIEKRSNTEIAELGKRGKGLIGAQRAALAGQNIDVSFGSALEIQEDTRSLINEDLKTIKANAWREAWGVKLAAQDIRGQARFAKIGADLERKMTLLSGGMKVLSSATKLIGMAG